MTMPIRNLTIDEILIKIRDAGVREDEIIGCSEEEILLVERRFGCELPKAYKEFLRKIGHQAGEFKSDLDFYYDWIKSESSNQKTIRKLNRLHIDKPSGCVIPEKVLFFASIYGDLYYFFNLHDQLDDPVVYSVNSDSNSITVAAWSFTDFLAHGLERLPDRVRWFEERGLR